MRLKVSLFLLELLIVFQYVNLVGDLFPSYIQIGLFFLWVLSIADNKKIIVKIIKLNYLSLLIFVVVFLRCIIAEKLDMSYFSPMQAVIARYQFFAYPCIFIYVSVLEKRDKRKIFNVSLISVLITVIVSFYYIFFIDPQAIRNTQGVSYWGVGDFQLMYAMAMFMGPLAMAIKKRKKEKGKCWHLMLAFILFGLCLLLCNLVTTVVIAAISITLSFAVSIKTKLKYFLGGGIITLIILLRQTWGNFLYKIADSGTFYWSTSNKIRAIANVIVGDFSYIDTLGLRITLIKQSLQSFKENPLFGINFRTHDVGVIGGHSQWPDDLGRYGIFGNAVIIVNYIMIAKYTINYNSNKEVRNLMLSVWITFFILGFLNPCLSGAILMVMFVVVPTFDAL